jgi:hypothetical protein
MKTSVKRLNRLVLELQVINNDGVKFGAYIRGRGKPSHDQILEIFKNYFNIFWVELEAVRTETESTQTLAVVKYRKQALVSVLFPKQ